MELQTTKGRLLFFLLLIITFPLLQHGFSFFESGRLNGAVTGAPDPVFNWQKWWDGSYQKQKNDYLNDSTGCRPDLVRLNNQVDFSLFKKRHAQGVVIAKNDCLYEQGYIDSYYGLDYAGETKLRTSVYQLRKIQDTLERLGKTFVYIYAPSKAYYLSEYLPDAPLGWSPATPTNYSTFRRLCDSAGIHQIDYNAWFLSMKKTTTGLPISRLGIHWTVYGSLLAADSFIKYIEGTRKIHMPTLSWEKETRTRFPRKTDDDLVGGLNLALPMRIEEFTYPEYHYTHKPQETLPRIIYIGDSFLWVWLFDDLMQNISKEFEIWYYFTESFNQNTVAHKEPSGHVDDIDWHGKLMASDCITLLYVTPTIKNFTLENSPIQKLYNYFYPGVKR